MISNEQRDPDLSKTYKELVSKRFHKTPSNRSREVWRWYRNNKGPITPFRTLDGKVFEARGKITKVAREYYKEVIKEGVKHPGRIYLKHIGSVEIYQIDSVNGKPRMVPDEDGKFIEVIDDYFVKHTKYVISFRLQMQKIRKDLIPFISALSDSKYSKWYLKLAYKLFPDGDFYTKRI